MPTLSLILALAIGGLLVAAVVWLVAAQRRLTAEQQMFAGFMEHGPFLAFMKDRNGRYIYENQALRDFVGRVRPGTDSLIGKTDDDVFDAPDMKTYVTNDQAALTHGKPMRFEETTLEANGTVRHWSSIKFPRFDTVGQPCIAGVSVDVSALMQARSDARSSEDRCKLALEAGRMGSMSLDLETLMLDTSPVFAVLHGNPETTTRISLADALEIVHPDDRPVLMEVMHAVLQNPGPHRVRYRVVAPDGAVTWITLVGNVTSDVTGRPTVIRAVAFDVTEMQQAFDDLARHRDMLRRLIDIQENERQTLCHELHDGPIQYAIAAKMQLESARDEDDVAIRTERIDAAVECLSRGIVEGRQVIRGVRPAVLDDLGLIAAIEELAEQQAAAALIVRTTLDDGLEALPPALQTTIYRVVQESLTNIRKHAGVDRAAVEIRRADDEVSVRVTDHGSGCDIDEARKQGFGMAGMMERVRLAGGTCRIESRPGEGTEITAQLPIQADDGRAGAAAESAGYAAVPDFLTR